MLAKQLFVEMSTGIEWIAEHEVSMSEVQMQLGFWLRKLGEICVIDLKQRLIILNATWGLDVVQNVTNIIESFIYNDGIDIIVSDSLFNNDIIMCDDLELVIDYLYDGKFYGTIVKQNEILKIGNKRGM